RRFRNMCDSFSLEELPGRLDFAADGSPEEKLARGLDALPHVRTAAANPHRQGGIENDRVDQPARALAGEDGVHDREVLFQVAAEQVGKGRRGEAEVLRAPASVDLAQPPHAADMV